MRISGIILIAIALLGVAVAAAEDTLIVPGVRVGSISADVGEADLVSMYGRDRVIDQRIGIGEGFVCSGAVIRFDGDDSLNVAWKDRKAKAGISLVVVNGRRWRTREGLGLGSTLSQLEVLNGTPFTVSGFGWDYGGVVVSWNGGQLDALTPRDERAGRIWFRQTPDVELSEEDLGVITGDKVVRSDQPALRRLNPSVSRLEVFLGNGQCEQYFDAD